MSVRSSRGISALVFSVALLGAAAGAALLGSPAPGVAHAQEAEVPGKYVGAAECRKCHESGLEGRPADQLPRLREYATWASEDRHAFAYERLDDEDPPAAHAAWRSKVTSEEIFDALGDTEADLASESERCLSCHGVVAHAYGQPKWLPEGTNRVVFANEDLQQGYDTAEGVSCDGCHGPASGWLKAHEARDWTLEQWLARGGAKDPAQASQRLYEELGLYYSKDLVLWAQQCVRCHLQIDPALIDAQHPDLEAFELWDQNSRVPPHWRDYTQAPDRPELPGAGPSHPARVWAVGQAVALQAALEQLVARVAAGASDEHVATAAERASSHHTVLRHALATLPATAQPAGALGEAMKTLAGAAGDDAAAAAKAALSALEPLPYALSRAALDAATVAKVVAAIEADADAKQPGMHAEVKALSLVALSKVK